VAERRYIERFGKVERIQHAVLMASFLALAATGLPLLFSGAGWASIIARLLGGYAVAGLIHRFFAITLIGVFVFHVGRLVHRIFIKGERNLLWGPESLVPQPRDLVEIYRHVKWFLRVGPQPQFDRYTYWEKFDYWAVFWGMFIIGGSGLMLWFPEVFSRVILTGRVEEQEFRHERALEAARLEIRGELDRLVSPPPSPRFLRWARLGGSIAVAIGLTLFVLIVYAFISH
jgi:cytochrome b subunit of formate dehydrogenase